MREDAFLQTADEDDIELQALCRVERDQGCRVRVFAVGVLVGDQGGLLQQPIDCILGRQVAIAPDDLAQLEEVGPCLLYTSPSPRDRG